MTAIFNWPFGAAMSFILLALTLASVAMFARSFRERWRIEGSR